MSSVLDVEAMLMLGLKRRWSVKDRGRDDGQGVVEYVGIVLAVAILISTMASFTQVGQTIGQTILVKICEALDGDCSDLYPGAPDDDPPDIECVEQTGEAVVSLDASVFIFEQGSEIGIVTEKLSDGTYRVTLVDGGSLGVGTGTGKFDATFRIGGKGGEWGAGASVSAGIEGATGVEYVFESEEELMEFYQWAAKEQSADLVRSFSPVVGWGADRIGDAIDWVTGNSYSPPAPTAHYIEGGVYADGSAIAGNGFFGGGEAGLAFSEIVGVRMDDESGESTVYAKFSAEGDIAVDMGFKPVAGASGEVESVFAMTFDSSGELVNVGVDMATAGEASYDLNDLLGIPNSWTIGSDGWRSNSTSGGLLTTMSLPVTDENRTQVVEALNGIGVINGLRDGSGPLAPYRWLAQEVVRNGDVVVQDIDVTNNEVYNVGVNAELPLIEGAGVGSEGSSKTTVANNSWYLGRHGWISTEGCW